MKKIIFLHLPRPLEQALAEHLETFTCFELSFLKEAAPDLPAQAPDLVVAATEVKLAGCPVLVLRGAEKPERLGAILRQIGQMLAQPVLYIDDMAIGPYTFKPQERILSSSTGEDIALTDREVDILAYLARYPAQPVGREALLKNVWQYQEGLDTHTLETHIYRLRQKMEAAAEEPQWLRTVEGGYSLHLSATGTNT